MAADKQNLRCSFLYETYRRWMNSEQDNEPDEECFFEPNYYLILQWAAICIINAFALINYLEIWPFLYNVYPIGAAEFMLRCLFSDLIAFFERKRRNYPAVWWLLGFLFPPVTLAYIYFVPFDEERQPDTQFKLTIGFAVACAIYWVLWTLPSLYEFWWG